MKFKEDVYIDLTNTPMTFIYFLIYNEDVVYVGQTTRGLTRVYSHISDKQFNKIYIIEVEEDNLDYWEDFYIFKYKPIYNKVPNWNCNFSIAKAVRKARNYVEKNYNKYPSDLRKPLFKKMLNELNIKPREYNGEFYIGIEDYYMILDCIDDYAKGAPLSEVFDIGLRPRKNSKLF